MKLSKKYYVGRSGKKYPYGNIIPVSESGFGVGEKLYINWGGSLTIPLGLTDLPKDDYPYKIVET